MKTHMGDISGDDLDRHLCVEGSCPDGYFVEMNTSDNKLRPQCLECPTVTKVTTMDGGITYTIDGGDINYRKGGATIDEIVDDNKYRNLRQCGDSYFSDVTKDDLFGNDYSELPGCPQPDNDEPTVFTPQETEACKIKLLGSVISGIDVNNQPDFCDKLEGDVEFTTTQVSEFTECVHTSLNINTLTQRLNGYTSYKDLTQIDIQQIHSALNKMMNLRVNDISECLGQLDDTDKCTSGFTKPLLQLVRDIEFIVRGIKYDIKDAEDEAMHQRTRSEFRVKIPLTIRHLIDLSQKYELSYTSGCDDVSPQTTYMEDLHSQHNIKIDPVIHPFDIFDTSDGIGIHIINLVSIGIIIYISIRAFLK